LVQPELLAIALQLDHQQDRGLDLFLQLVLPLQLLCLLLPSVPLPVSTPMVLIQLKLKLIIIDFNLEQALYQYVHLYPLLIASLQRDLYMAFCRAICLITSPPSVCPVSFPALLVSTEKVEPR